MLSFRQYIQEVFSGGLSYETVINELFSGGDRGYPFEENPPSEYQKRKRAYSYSINVPGNVRPGTADFFHMVGSGHAGTAHVSFSMPRNGYGISPGAKETYHNAYNDHIKNSRPIGTRFRGAADLSAGESISHSEAHNVATAAVLKKHGSADANLADASQRDGITVSRSNNSAARHNYGMFATMRKIIDYHGKKRPEIKHFKFSSSNDGVSRDKLYGVLAQKHGGTTKIDSSGNVVYNIPNPHHIPKRKRNPL